MFLEEFIDYTWNIPDLLINVPVIITSKKLRPEKIITTEIAYGGNHRYNSSSVNFDFRLFQDKVSDILVNPRDSNAAVWSLDNDGSYTMRGIDIQFQYNTDSGHFIHFGHSVTSSDGTIKDKTNPDVYLDISLFTPEQTTTLLYSKKISKRLSAGINYYRVTTMEFISGDQTGGYDTADLSVKYQLTTGKKPAQLSFLAKNISGSYFDYEDETALERQFYISFKSVFLIVKGKRWILE